jgi:hypothetical protein
VCVYKVEVARARAGNDEARHFLVERRSRRQPWSHEVDITAGTRFILPVPHALALITIDVKRKIQPADIVYFSSSLPADQSYKRHALVRGIVVPGAFIVSDQMFPQSFCSFSRHRRPPARRFPRSRRPMRRILQGRNAQLPRMRGEVLARRAGPRCWGPAVTTMRRSGINTARS